VRDVSSPNPEQVEYAKVLLRRAKGDLQACRKLADDTEIDDNNVGFLAVDLLSLSHAPGEIRTPDLRFRSLAL
jgi:hypothetical protein